MVGGGAHDQWTRSGNLLTGSFPAGRNQWQAEGRNHRRPGPATVTSYIIGLRHRRTGAMPRCSIKQATSTKTNHPAVEVSADRDHVIVGGGGFITQGPRGQGNFLTETYVKRGMNTFRVAGKDHIWGDQQRAVAYVIQCEKNVRIGEGSPPSSGPSPSPSSGPSPSGNIGGSSSQSPATGPSTDPTTTGGPASTGEQAGSQGNPSTSDQATPAPSDSGTVLRCRAE